MGSRQILWSVASVLDCDLLENRSYDYLTINFTGYQDPAHSNFATYACGLHYAEKGKLTLRAWIVHLYGILMSNNLGSCNLYPYSENRSSCRGGTIKSCSEHCCIFIKVLVSEPI
jgi:hypothetical protein